MNNIQYSFRTNTSKILDIRGPNPLIRASSDHLAFPFQTFLPLPLGKNVLCHLSQPGIQLTSQHLAKSHAPVCVCVDPCRPFNRRAALTITFWEHLPTGMFGGSQASP